jgi:hypothetical protein
MIIGSTILAVLIVCGIILLAARWPFAREAAAKTLGEAFASTVQFGTFHQTWFPYPGFEAGEVTLIPTQGLAAGHVQAASLRLDSSWFGLFRHHVRRMTVDDITIRIRSLGEGAFAGHVGTTVIERAELRDAILQIGDKREEERFVFHDVHLENVGHDRQVSLRIGVAIPRPPGELDLHGNLGPLVYGELAGTPLSGSYQLTRADLGVFRGIAGVLSSEGSYSGRLAKLEVKGNVNVPDFEVKESGHAHHLTAQFQAAVNGTNGDTILPKIEAALDGTSFQRADARIEGRTSGGKRNDAEKSVSLNIASARGGIQDLMLLFIKAPHSPILGPVGFRARIFLPPGDRPFKERVILEGDFGITGAGFTKPSTQASAEELSERAEGEAHDAPEHVLSDLTGHVMLRNGIATFSTLSFRVPGASANLAGTFNILSERIDLHGKLATEAKLSKTTTGIKSALLKVLDPIFQHKPAGAVVPVSVTGTYEQPTFRELLTK